jgi:hypothetical protein
MSANRTPGQSGGNDLNFRIARHPPAVGTFRWNSRLPLERSAYDHWAFGIKVLSDTDDLHAPRGQERGMRFDPASSGLLHEINIAGVGS